MQFLSASTFLSHCFFRFQYLNTKNLFCSFVNPLLVLPTPPQQVPQLLFLSSVPDKIKDLSWRLSHDDHALKVPKKTPKSTLNKRKIARDSFYDFYVFFYRSKNL